jgi:hypothetical protein
MTRIVLALTLLSAAACVPAGPSPFDNGSPTGNNGSLPVHPDPNCYYDYNAPDNGSPSWPPAVC